MLQNSVAKRLKLINAKRATRCAPKSFCAAALNGVTKMRLNKMDTFSENERHTCHCKYINKQNNYKISSIINKRICKQCVHIVQSAVYSIFTTSRAKLYVRASFSKQAAQLTSALAAAARISGKANKTKTDDLK